MKGRAVLFMGARKPFEITEYEVPDPEPGAIVLRITQAGVCGSDLHSWRGDGQPAPVPPGGRTTGHEGTGVVYKLGKDVTTDSLGRPLKEGDRIIYSAISPCGHCYQCLNGNPNWCKEGFFRRAPTGEWPYFNGTYADYYYIRPNQEVFKVPDELPDSVLGFVNCAMGTVTEGLLRAGCKEGDYVVIQGAGGLGLNAIAAAKDMGAHRVIVLDRLENRLELAREFGADDTINVDQEWTTPDMRRQRVWELTDGRGADIVMELVGRSELFSEGIEYLTNGGTFVEIGNIVRGNPVAFDPSALIFSAKRIIGSPMYRPSLLPMMLETLVKKQGKLPYDKIVSHSFPLEKINEAFEQAEWLDRQTSITRSMLVTG
jgi:threonine dehydrogenase-like Zn-dependent dehydrogenase